MITIGEKERAEFGQWLEELECSRATIQKYTHDVGVLAEYAGDTFCDKKYLNGFRKYLEERGYCACSINSMLAAANKFLQFVGTDWKLRYVKAQRKVFMAEHKELTSKEYAKMIQQAEAQRDDRTALLLQTLCGLGIRVSELQAITVESLEKGEAVIQNKGKVRTILIPKSLSKKLMRYCSQRGLLQGAIFITRSGKPLDCSNIWRMMKRLAKKAKVAAEKVFPHNLRHLFARSYYEKFKDIVRLVDILGHSSIDTTRIYTARSGHEERRQLDQLSLILG